MSLGTILLWGGIGGLVLFAVIGIVAWRVLSKRGKKLLRAIEEEYV